MFATIVQKWNAFKADCKEYKRLCSRARKAWHRLYKMRANVTTVRGVNDEGGKKSCIKTQFVDIPTLNMMDDVKGSVTFVSYDNYCPYFKDLDETVAVCRQTDCPCHAANCEYANAFKEYAEASARRRAFWGSISKTK